MLSIYRRKRLEKGYRQVDLATLTGLSQSKISAIERGLWPKGSEREKIEKALGMRSVKKSSATLIPN